VSDRITHVIDACAVVAYLKKEKGVNEFADLLKNENNVMAIHCINLCEVYYSFLRSDGETLALEAWNKISDFLGVVELTEASFLRRVGWWKVDRGLYIGDAFAAATAEEFGSKLVTTDHKDFDDIDNRKEIDIKWLR